MPSILDGVSEIVDQFFELEEIGKPPHYGHISSCKKLSKNPPIDLNGIDLLQKMYDQILSNWGRLKNTHETQPSQENWRFTQNPYTSEDNDSPEVGLERYFIKIADGLWANQVPTSSGLLGPDANKHTKIDMVFKSNKKEFEFIELKIHSNQPLYAAIEIIGYGMIYHFTMNHLSNLGYSDSGKEILEAEHIHLKVLAPKDYYTDHNMRWLENMLDKGLADFHSLKEWKMDFRFERLPEPITTATKEIDSQLARAAIKGRSPLYP